MPKSKDRRDEIAEVVQELHDAMVESLDAAEAEDKAKIRKIKAQKRLLLAKEAVRAVSLNE